MDLLQTMLQAGGGSAVQQLAETHGLTTDQVTSVLAQLAPALAGGISHQTQQEGGLAGLMGALTGGQHQQYIDDPSTLAAPGAVEDGNGILGHLFGSKDVSRHVAAQASAATGVSDSIIKSMLPMVASLAMGAMAKRVLGGGAGGGMGGMLGGVLGQAMSGGGMGGALGGVLGSTFGGGGAPSLGGAGGGLMDMLGPLLGGGGQSAGQTGQANAAPTAGGTDMASEVIGMLGKMMGR